MRVLYVPVMLVLGAAHIALLVAFWGNVPVNIIAWVGLGKR